VAGWIEASRRACTAAGLPRMDALSSWTARSLGPLRVAVVAAGVLVLVLYRYRTPELVGWLAVAVLAALAVLQFLAAGPGTRRLRT
jgi:hypothetical protein